MKTIFIFISCFFILSCSSQKKVMLLNPEEIYNKDKKDFKENKYLVLDYIFNEADSFNEYSKLLFNLNSAVLKSKKLKEYDIISVSEIKDKISDCNNIDCKINLLKKYQYHTRLNLNICNTEEKIIINVLTNFKNNYFQRIEFNYSKSLFSLEESVDEISQQINENMKTDLTTKIMPDWIYEDDYITQNSDGSISFKVKGFASLECSESNLLTEAKSNALTKILKFQKAEINLAISKDSFMGGVGTNGNSRDIDALNGEIKEQFFDNKGNSYILFTNIK